MNQKTLVIAVVAVIIVVAVVTGVYLATQGGGGGPTPTPTPTATPSGSDIAGASSLQFSVEITGGEAAGTYKYIAKNIGESDMMIRVEITNSYELIDIINGAQNKAWESVDGEWTDISANYAATFNAWNSTFAEYKSRLADWTGVSEWTYTNTDGSSVRIYDITVNPALADSLFEHS